MEAYVSKLIEGKILTEREMEDVCERVIRILISEPNIPNKTTPISICGDIHGQFYDLLSIFRINGSPKDKKYIFLGDYVDRGSNSVEVVSLLFVYKVMYPENITLVRGNHESREITRIYGFYDEVLKKYGSSYVWRICCEVFDCLNVGCIVDGRVLCVHGGISPKVTSINQLKRIYRFQAIPENSEFSDIVWSDPDERNGFIPNSRGAGYYFGNDVTRRFLELNDLTTIVRSHQLVMEGYQFNFPDKTVVTVWSAPNYCYRCGNLASFLRLDSSLEINEKSFCVFREVSQEPNYDILLKNFI